jgi:hypothetical protein
MGHAPQRFCPTAFAISLVCKRDKKKKSKKETIFVVRVSSSPAGRGAVTRKTRKETPYCFILFHQQLPLVRRDREYSRPAAVVAPLERISRVQCKRAAPFRRVESQSGRQNAQNASLIPPYLPATWACVRVEMHSSRSIASRVILVPLSHSISSHLRLPG